MNQKEIKAIKQSIVESSALNIGYFSGTKEAIIKAEPMLLNEVMAGDMAEYLTQLAREGKEGEFDNVFITEAVKVMKYSEFKQVASQFFSYQKTQSEILAEPIEIKRSTFLALQKQAAENFKETETYNLRKSIESITKHLVSNGKEAIGFDPLSEELVILNNESDLEPFFDEGLISDYRSPKTEIELIVETLYDRLSSSQLNTIIQEIDGGSGINAKELEPENLVEALNGNSNGVGRLTDEDIKTINTVIASDQKELIVHDVYGYSQGEYWPLSYLWDKVEYPNFSHDQIVNYLEHEVGAYYRGSLAEIEFYDNNNDFIDAIQVDQEEMWLNPIEKVRELTQNQNFVDIVTGFEIQQEKAKGVEITTAYIENYQVEKTEHGPKL
ncbi:MAG: hypothetical protein LBS33_08745 [Streptococcaceae bacterium]|jgi:hypothetical protein|nr:hypothetical protein [Streptococcaceae bacterium]